MTPRLSASLLLVLLLGAPTSGCTAAKASIQTVSAEEALRKAKEYEADEIAAYEYTMALRYLEKAREEIGYSQFRVADALARQSAEWSDRAIIFVEKRGRSEINLSDFQETTTPPTPPPTPAPAPPAPVDPGMQDILSPAPVPVPGPAPMPDEELDEILGTPSAAPAPAPAPAPIDLGDDE